MGGLRASFDVSHALKLAKDLVVFGSQAKTIPERVQSKLRRSLPVEARRDIQEEYWLQAQRINRGLYSRNIPGGVELVGEARGIGLVTYGATYAGPKSPGVSVRVTKGGGRKIIKRSFIPKYKNPNQVFIRREVLEGSSGPLGVKANTGGKSRLVRLFGPSVGQQLKKPERVERLATIASAIAEKETLRLLRYL